MIVVENISKSFASSKENTYPCRIFISDFSFRFCLVCFVTNKFGKNGGEVLLLLSENAIISKLINLQKSQL
jgi:hypothetical protein